MNPIPSAFLPHMCSLVTVFTNGDVSEKLLTNVRIETEKKSAEYRTGSAVLWYDCTNSMPKNTVFALSGETIGERTVRRQYGVLEGGEFDVKAVKKFTGPAAVHHIEVTLGGVIPYNG
jgi:hypothetical protein